LTRTGLAALLTADAADRPATVLSVLQPAKPGVETTKARFLAAPDFLVAEIGAGADSRLVVLRLPAAP
jgi:hypothetical protein